MDISKKTPEEWHKELQEAAKSGDLEHARLLLKDTTGYDQAKPSIRVAEILEARGDLQSQLSLFGEAQVSFDRALRCWSEAAPSSVAKIVELRHKAGNTSVSQGEYLLAMQHFQAALDINTAAEHALLRADSLLGLGNVHFYLGNYEQTLEFFQQTLQLKQQVYHDPLAKEFIHILNNLGIISMILGRFQLALEYGQQAVAAIRHNPQDIPDATLAVTLMNLGNAQNSLGRYEQAMASYQQALEHMNSLYGQTPHSDTAALLSNLGALHGTLGQFEQGLILQRQALDMMTEVYGGQPHLERAMALNSLGELSVQLQDYSQALEYYQQALAVSQAIYGDEPQANTALSLLGLGESWAGLGQDQQAQQALERALRMFLQVYGEQPHPNLVLCLTRLGQVMVQRHQPEEAIRQLQVAKQQVELIYGREPHLVGLNVQFPLAKAYWHSGQPLTCFEILLDAMSQHLQFMHAFAGLVSTAQTLKLNAARHEHLALFFEAFQRQDRALPEVALALWLNFKGSAGALDTALQVIVAAHPELQPLYHDLIMARRQVSHLRSSPAFEGDLDTALKEATEALHAAELALRKYAREAFDLREIQVAEVVSALHPDEVYLDFAATQEEWYAFTLREVPGQRPQVTLHHLASVQEVSELVDQLRQQLSPAPTFTSGLAGALFMPADLKEFRDPDGPAAKLFHLLIRPLSLPDANLVICPDQDLNFLPFDLLYDTAKGQFLLEGHSVRLIPFARDLIRLHRQTAPDSFGEPVLMGYPDYAAHEAEMELYQGLDLLQLADERLAPDTLLLQLELQERQGKAVMGVLALHKGQSGWEAQAYPLDDLTLEDFSTLVEQGDWGALNKRLFKPFRTLPQHMILIVDPRLPQIPENALSLPGGQTIHLYRSLRDWLEHQPASFAPADAERPLDQSGGLLQAWEHSNHEVILQSPATGSISHLPRTFTQIVNIANALHDLNPRTFLGAAASLATLRQVTAARTPFILHLTTHGLLFQAPAGASLPEHLRDPLQRMALCFAGAGWFDPLQVQGWGLLSAFEFSTLNLLGTRLVNLAACETALGEAQGGEGLRGFVQAAFLAGARCTMTALWAIESGSTERFMADFYRRWQQAGLERPDLILTKLKRQRLSAQVKPFYWAGFTLHGN